MEFPFFVGGPVWQHPNWPAHLLGGLNQYSQYFNAVEGNTTFYALPTQELAQRWAQDTPDHFRFCFKLHQDITHKQQLANCQTLLRDYFVAIEPVLSRCGPFMIQLPATFGPQQLSNLAQFIPQLPKGLSFAVEVRHPEFFTKGQAERDLNNLLLNNGIERVSYDTRAMFKDQEAVMSKLDFTGQQIYRKELDAKPKLPVRPCGFTQHPVVRIMSSPNLNLTDSILPNWHQKLIQWLDQGKQPFLFFHVPNEQHVPNMIDRALSHFGFEDVWPKPQVSQLGLV